MSIDSATFIEELSNLIVDHTFFTLDSSTPITVEKAVINYNQNIISIVLSDKTEFNILVKGKG